MHASWSPWSRRIAGALLAATACGGPVGVKGPGWGGHDHDHETSGPPNGGSTSYESTTGRETSLRWPNDDEEEDESSGSMPGVVFLIDPDVPPIWLECDIFDQACPPDEKCMWIEDVHGNWRGTRCMPIFGEPAAPGEPCMVLGGLWSGIDSCDVGGVCWHVDDMLEGTCIAFCVGDESNPECESPDSYCNISNGWPYAFCTPRCDPLLQGCPEGQACYPVQDEWVCAPDASSDDAGGYGDPCEYINVCDPGYVCLDSSTVPAGEACEGAPGCCTAVCDIAEPLGDAQCEGAAGGQTCQPWYQEGTAPPGHEDVGACALPA